MAKRSPALRIKKARRQAVPAAEDHPRSWYRDEAGAIWRDIGSKEIAGILEGGSGLLWVDLDADSATQRELLSKVFKFHPLSVEDTTSREGRVKFEEFPAYALVVVRGVRFLTETDDLYDIEDFNLWSFIGRNFVVTVHGPHAPGVDATIERLERAPETIGRGAPRLLHHILDATVDAYFPIIDQLDGFVDQLESRVFVHFDHEAMRDIFAVKRLVLQLKRHLAPMREVFNILQSRPCAHLTPEAQVYFRDVYDHVIRQNEALDTYRELISSTLDAYLTQVSNRMGLVTKGLTVVATLSVPFVVVSGMWGMNFAHIPLSDWPHGFWVMLGLQLGLGGGLLWYLRRNGWL